MMTTTTHVSNLSDAALLSATSALARKSHEVTAEFVQHLGEVDVRKLFLGRAWPSMFAYCVGELGLSEDATCNLVTVARLARRLPTALVALRSGRVHLSGLRVLAPHLTPENCSAVLDEAAGHSKRDIEELVARLAPRPPVADSIRKLPRTPPPPVSLFDSPPAHLAPALMASGPVPGTPRGEDTLAHSTVPAEERTAGAPCQRASESRGSPRHTTVTPLSEDTFKVQFTASRALRDKLRQAQDLLRHSVPSGELSAIVERAVDLLIADVKKKRFGIRTAGSVAPQPAPRDRAACPASPTAPETREPAPTSSRHVPVDIRRTVYERDGGQCTFVADDGRRCGETGGLELDHADGFARTGTHSVEGLRLRCGPHNQHAAELMYGRAFMESARRRIRPGADNQAAVLHGQSSTRGG